MKSSILRSAAALAMAAASGCAAYHPCPFHVKETTIGHCQGTGKSAVDSRPEYSIGFVEFDDQGWLWNREQMEEVLKSVQDAASRGGAVIVVYVHGWHHNADEGDGDVAAFRDSLKGLHESLNEPELKNLRRAALQETGPKNDAATGEATVLGIYVGWRGGSLPGGLDFLTFSERKRAAHRVGHGDVGELLVRLNQIHARSNDKGLYTGLVVVGHSFGGAVVFSAISDKLQIDLGAMSRGAEPVPVSARETLCTSDRSLCLRAVGDLVVLVNPAFESSLYHSIDQLARTSRFDRCQTPVLLTVSSEADWPNRRYFPIGQVVLTQEQGVLRDSQQKHEVHTSLGNFRGQVTHCLKADPGDDCTSIPGYGSAQPGPQGADSPRETAARAAAATTEHKDPCAQPLGAGGKFADTVLYRVNDDGQANNPVMPSNSPVMLARATGELIPGHDLFAGAKTEKFKGFLVKFVHDLIYQKLGQRRAAHEREPAPAR